MKQNVRQLNKIVRKMHYKQSQTEKNVVRYSNNETWSNAKATVWKSFNKILVLVEFKWISIELKNQPQKAELTESFAVKNQQTTQQ